VNVSEKCFPGAAHREELQNLKVVRGKVEENVYNYASSWSERMMSLDLEYGR